MANLKKRFTDEQIVEALKESRGFLCAASRRLGCSYKTLQRRLESSESVREAREEAREEFKDFAEAKLHQRIQEGDTACLIFFLKTQCRDRGYSDRFEQEHTGGLTVRIVRDRTDPALPASGPDPAA